MSRLLPLSQSRSKTSLLSSTTYHSFYDAETQEPQQLATTVHDLDEPKPSSAEMHRQDSGYESITPGNPVLSGTRRRTSTMTTTGSTTSSRGSKKRPTVRRSAKSVPATRMSKTTKPGSRSLPLTQSQPVTVPTPFYGYNDNSPYSSHNNALNTYFQFPTLEPGPNAGAGGELLGEVNADNSYAEATLYPLPPPTTHYWTSDRTRRLEYAAIDAASRGFKGWMMRHMVPDCFVPKEKRRVTFDDDTGSVRRYRIELESEESTEKDVASAHAADRRSQKKSWPGTWWP